MTAVPQHMVALSRGNRIRIARAELKRKVRSGERSVAGVIYQSPEEAETMTVFDLLCAQHRWGETRACELLTSIPMLETKTIGSMTERQRSALIERLEREAS